MALGLNCHEERIAQAIDVSLFRGFEPTVKQCVSPFTFESRHVDP